MVYWSVILVKCRNSSKTEEFVGDDTLWLTPPLFVGVGEIHRKNVLGEDTMYIHSDLSEVNLLVYRLLPHQMMVGLTTITSSPRTCDT